MWCQWRNFNSPLISFNFLLLKMQFLFHSQLRSKDRVRVVLWLELVLIIVIIFLGNSYVLCSKAFPQLDFDDSKWSESMDDNNKHRNEKFTSTLKTKNKTKMWNSGKFISDFAPLVLQRNRLPLHVVKGPSVTYGFKLNLQHCAHVACLANQGKDECRLG